MTLILAIERHNAPAVVCYDSGVYMGEMRTIDRTPKAWRAHVQTRDESSGVQRKTLTDNGPMTTSNAPLVGLSRSAWSLCGLGHTKARHCLSLAASAAPPGACATDTCIPPGRSTQAREGFFFGACGGTAGSFLTARDVGCRLVELLGL